jgi:hypothetical protein
MLNHVYFNVYMQDSDNYVKSCCMEAGMCAFVAVDQTVKNTPLALVSFCLVETCV